jgi:hypothetical protein
MAERRQALLYLIVSFGVIRPYSTFVESDQKRITVMIDARAADNRVEQSVAAMFASPSVP